MVTFDRLWKNHPVISDDIPVLDRTTYPNQCAINLSAALIKSGIELKGFRGALSWQKGKPKYAIRAEELGRWLDTPNSKLNVKAVKYKGEEAFDKIQNQRGIILFQNYYGPGMSGDHIDLWNGSRLTKFSSWFRIHLNIVIEGHWENYKGSQRIWFWKIL